MRLGTRSVSLSSERIERRIFYRLPWTGDADRNNDNGQLLVLRAQKILQSDVADASLLRGRIVVIGSSSPVAGDIQATPIGMMPGSLVLINAMSTLMRGEQLHDVGFAGTIGIELLLIAIVSVLFAVLPAATALVLALLLVVIGSVTVGFAALNSGVWIDSVLPALGVIVHEIVHRVQHYLHELKHAPYKHMR
jgi:CHASE2 domain-containing sensor protein